MAVREIHTFPSDVLKREAEPVEVFDGDLQILIDDMLQTMYAAPGIGLAAPQVGVSRRVIVIDLSTGMEPDQVHVLVNPQLVASEGEVESEEGCLSLPEVTLKICRAGAVTVRARDRNGDPLELTADGLLARALQHEIDHLDGVLLFDRIHPIRRELVKKRLRKKALAET